MECQAQSEDLLSYLEKSLSIAGVGRLSFVGQEAKSKILDRDLCNKKKNKFLMMTLKK